MAIQFNRSATSSEATDDLLVELISNEESWENGGG